MRLSGSARLMLGAAALALICRSAETAPITVEFAIEYSEDWLDTMVDSLRDKTKAAGVRMPKSDSPALKIVDKNGDDADPGGEEPEKDRFPLRVTYVDDGKAHGAEDDAGAELEAQEKQQAEEPYKEEEDIVLDDNIPETPKRAQRPKRAPRTGTPPKNTEFAILAAGRFWTLEAIYQRTPGIVKVVGGYTGDEDEDSKPNYKDVQDGTTDHVQALRIEFDPKEISYKEILEEYFAAIDPTTKNRQHGDVGKQYQSILFYNDDSQKEEIEAAIDRKQDALGTSERKKIVTKVQPAVKFWDVLSLKEVKHHNFYNKCLRDVSCPNPGFYKHVVIPKLEELGLSTEDSGDDVNDVEPAPPPPTAKAPQGSSTPSSSSGSERTGHEEL